MTTALWWNGVLGLGPCPMGFWPDGRGCCPEVINGLPYYRDGRGCYPRVYDGVAYWPDGNGCYPDTQGHYTKSVVCPVAQKCWSTCVRPVAPTPTPNRPPAVDPTSEARLRCGGSGLAPDENRCCPRVVAGVPYYRDRLGCYPTLIPAGVRYADGLGCYPDAKGRYRDNAFPLPAARPVVGVDGSSKPPDCPEAQICRPACDTEDEVLLIEKV